MTASKETCSPENSDGRQVTRRDFFYVSASAVGVFGAAALTYTLFNKVKAPSDSEVFSHIDVDVSHLKPGDSMTILWQGSPVFIRHRTREEISAAQHVDCSELLDPEEDALRVQKPEWLVVVGVCTHLGCIPQGQKPGEKKGEFGGWFCSCHGSSFDSSGRVRSGPASKNLKIPPYQFVKDHVIRIG